MKKCKNEWCAQPVARGEGLVSRTARALGYCRYCYQGEFPRRRRRLPPLRWNGRPILSWSQRRELERTGFNTLLWSREFQAEMESYWEARMRGEL